MTNKELRYLIQRIKENKYLTRDETNYIIKALEQEPCEIIKEIPKDYKYDTETEDFLVYRHMYTGHEIHIEKLVPRYRLEQELCGDAISRQAVLDINEHHHGQMPNHVHHEIWKEIKALPPVTPQPKMGYWIKIKSGDKDFPESIVCSRCGNENSHLDFNENAEPIGKVFVTSKFCPNCGAKMFEPQESDK